MHYRNRQSSMIISPKKGIKTNKNNDLKIKNLKSTKVISSIYRKFGEKKNVNFKKLSQGTVSTKVKDILNYKRIGNKIRKSSNNNILLKSFSVILNKENQSKNLQINVKK